MEVRLLDQHNDESRVMCQALVQGAHEYSLAEPHGSQGDGATITVIVRLVTETQSSSRQHLATCPGASK